MEMSSIRFLSEDSLPGFLQSLGQPTKQSAGQPRRVLVPVNQGRGVIFAPWSPDVDMSIKRTNVPPKEAVLPACETLLSYRRTRQEDGSLALALDSAPHAVPTVIFGGRPCDAHGIAVLDRPFTQGPYRDPYYQARRDQLLIITRACNAPRSTCFCHWVGSHPHDCRGSDILLIEISAFTDQVGCLLQAITPKGEELLQSTDLPDGSPYLDAIPKAEAQARSFLSPAPDISSVREKVAALFTDEEFWHKQTAPCRGCGACTYFCPGCYCFNITDEGDGMIVKEDDKPGRRLRTWDNCMAAHFTREASGHNARTLKAQRMRNRISHKFGNYPTLWDGAYSCTGCGRCINQCPVHMDMRALVMAVVEK